MDLQEKIQFWKNEIERAEQNDFYFDTHSMKDVVDTVVSLLEGLESKNEYIGHLEHENNLLYGRLNNIIALANKEIK
jgi:hypothetical protein